MRFRLAFCVLNLAGLREPLILTSISQVLDRVSFLSWELCNGMQMLVVGRDFSQWCTKELSKRPSSKTHINCPLELKKEMHSYLHVDFILSNPEGIVESVWRKWYWILLSLLSTILNFDFLGGDSECKGSILWLKEKVHQCKPSESF